MPKQQQQQRQLPLLLLQELRLLPLHEQVAAVDAPVVASCRAVLRPVQMTQPVQLRCMRSLGAAQIARHPVRAAHPPPCRLLQQRRRQQPPP